MSNHTSEIPEWLNNSYMENVMKNVINKQTTITSLTVTPGSGVGDNYICQIFRIKLELLDGGKTNEMYVIGKFNNETPIEKEMAGLDFHVNKIEGKFLSETLPVLNNYYQGRNIGPKCYHTDYEKKIIFMEDLKQQGFTLVPRDTFLDIHHCFKTIQAHATLHAASYLELQKNPQLAIDYNKNMWGKEVPEYMSKFMDNNFKGIEEKMDIWHFTTKQKQLIAKLKQKITDEGFQTCLINPKSFNVITHGDCWKNNMMYRYEKNDVKEVCLLDFQMVNYNSFALDLQYFLSSSAAPEVRYEQIDDVLEFYYKEFTKIAPNVSEFSLARVKKEFEEKTYFGFLNSIMMRPLVVSAGGMDLDSILDGNNDSGMFRNPAIGEELKKALDYFANMF